MSPITPKQGGDQVSEEPSFNRSSSESSSGSIQVNGGSDDDLSDNIQVKSTVPLANMSDPRAELERLMNDTGDDAGFAPNTNEKAAGSDINTPKTLSVHVESEAAPPDLDDDSKSEGEVNKGRRAAVNSNSKKRARDSKYTASSSATTAPKHAEHFDEDGDIKTPRSEGGALMNPNTKKRARDANDTTSSSPATKAPKHSTAEDADKAEVTLPRSQLNQMVAGWQKAKAELAAAVKANKGAAGDEAEELVRETERADTAEAMVEDANGKFKELLKRLKRARGDLEEMEDARDEALEELGKERRRREKVAEKLSEAKEYGAVIGRL